MTYKSIEIEPNILLYKLNRIRNSYRKANIKKKDRLLTALLEAEKYTVAPTSETRYLTMLNRLSAHRKRLGYLENNLYKVEELVSVLEDYDIKYKITEFTL